MLKRIGIGFGILAWLIGGVSFYLQLHTSGLSGPAQIAVLTGCIASGLVILAYLLGLEVGYRKTGVTLQNLGILRIFRRADVDKVAPLSSLIQNATSDIFFMGLSLPKLDGFTGLLEDKSCNGVQVRLLVPDPCEKELILTIARFLRREGPYPRELSWFFNNFLPVWKKAPNNFHIRVYKQIPTMSAAMFDGKQGNIELYMYGWRTDDRLILELNFGGTARDWKANLEMIWHEAIPLSSENMFHERIEAADRITEMLKSKHKAQNPRRN